MPNMSNTQRQHRSDPALVLLDSFLEVISYSVEATRILTYPKDPNDALWVSRMFEAKLRPLLPNLTVIQRNPLRLIFQSGKRQYVARMFSLENHEKPSDHNRLSPAYALLFERQYRKVVDVS